MTETHIPLAPIAQRRGRLSRRRALRTVTSGIAALAAIGTLSTDPSIANRATRYAKEALRINKEIYGKPIIQKNGAWITIDEKDKKIVAFILRAVPLNTNDRNRIVPLHEEPNIGTPAELLEPSPKTVYFGYAVAGGGFNAVADTSGNSLGKHTVYHGNKTYENVGTWYMLTDQNGRGRTSEKPQFVSAASVQELPEPLLR